MQHHHQHDNPDVAPAGYGGRVITFACLNMSYRTPAQPCMKSALVLLQMQLTLSVASIVACFVYMPKHPLDAQAPVLQARPQFVLLYSGTEELFCVVQHLAAVIVTLGCCRLVPYNLC